MADECLSEGSFTFLSDYHNSTSWIDHVLVNSFITSVITDLSILYDVVASDHRPLSFKLSVRAGHVNNIADTNNHCITTPDWKASSEIERYLFKGCLENLLHSITVPHCINSNCTKIK